MSNSQKCNNKLPKSSLYKIHTTTMRIYGVFIMITIFLLGCSDYSISHKITRETVQDTGYADSIQAVPTTDNTNNTDIEEPVDEVNEEESIDESIEEDLPPAGEDSPSQEYCTEFDNFEEWSFFGDGNWHVDNGILYENRGGYYASVAYMYNFGAQGDFEISVSTGWQGSLNDLAGFVFNLDPVLQSYWLVRIDDPQGSYQRYSPTGRIEIAFCDSNGCTIMAHDDSADLYFPADESFVNWSFSTQGEFLTVTWNGQIVFSQNIPGLPGPGLVGLYSNDNDGGVIYDNFCVLTNL